MMNINCTEYPLHVKIIGRSERVLHRSLNESIVIPFEIKYNNNKYYAYKILILFLGLWWMFGVYHSEEAIIKLSILEPRLAIKLYTGEKELAKITEKKLESMYFDMIFIALVLFFNLYDIGPSIIYYICIFVSVIFSATVLGYVIYIPNLFNTSDTGAVIGRTSCILIYILTAVYMFYFENENEIFNFMVRMLQNTPVNLNNCNIILKEYTIYLQERLNEEQMTDALYSLTKFKNWFRKSRDSLETSIDTQFLNYIDRELGP